MRGRLSRAIWIIGMPARQVLLAVIWIYRATLSGFLGGRCRFYPSCSAYAQEVIKEWGAVRGLALAGWRVLRCSPLAGGGVDRPPRHGPQTAAPYLYDNNIHPRLSGLRGQEKAPTGSP